MNTTIRKTVSVLGLAVALSPASVIAGPVESDVHVQSDGDAVRLDIDRRTYEEILNFFNHDYPTASILLHAVSQGMSINDAVYLAVKARRDKAQEIYNTALDLLPSLPGWACLAGGTAADRYPTEYSLDELGPQATIQQVAQKFFDQNQRLAPFPDWQNGGYHMKGSVADLSSILGEGWRACPDQAPSGASGAPYWYETQKSISGGGIELGGCTFTQPIFISLYQGKEAKQDNQSQGQAQQPAVKGCVIVDDNLKQVEYAQSQGCPQAPVVFLYNEKNEYPVGQLGQEATLTEITKRFWGPGEETTPVPDWHNGDKHLDVKIDEFSKFFELPKKSDIDPQHLQELIQDIKQNGFKLPVRISLLQDDRIFTDDLERIVAAKEAGLAELPTVVLYHSFNRLACGQAATTCRDRICESAVAGGADPAVCKVPPGGTPPGTPPSNRIPPPPPGGGPASNS